MQEADRGCIEGSVFDSAPPNETLRRANVLIKPFHAVAANPFEEVCLDWYRDAGHGS